MRRIGLKKCAAAVMTAMLLTGCCAVSVQAELQLGGLGNEVNQFSVPVAGTAAGDVVALDDLGISVTVSDYTAIEESEGFVYIYTMESDSMPYVIVGYYDEEIGSFPDIFTEYMGTVYEDLRVAEQPGTVSIAGKEFARIGYEYTVSGYTIQDTRLFCEQNGKVYMFGAKEVPALNYFVGSGYLEQVAGSLAPLAGGDSDYDNHVDSERSVSGTSGNAVEDLGSAAGDVLPDQDAAGSGNPVGQSGSVGGVGSTDGQSSEDGRIVFDETAAGYEGVWVPFEDGFQVYLPVSWNEYELSDEQKQQGALYAAGDVSDSGDAPNFSSCWTYSDGYASLDDVAAEISSCGYIVDGIIWVNDIQCVSYRETSTDISGLMFFDPAGRNYLFSVVGGNYSKNVDTIAAILCSLRLV